MISDENIFGGTETAESAVVESAKPKLEGVIYDEPNEFYHANQAVSKTNLDTFRESPVTYRGVYLEKRIDRPTTKALSFGNAEHVFVLEGEAAFNKKFSVTPDGGFPLNTNKGKDGLEAFAMQAVNDGKLSVVHAEIFVGFIRQKERKSRTQASLFEKIRGSFMVEAKDYAVMHRMRDALMYCDDARSLMEGTQREVTFRTPVLDLGFRAQSRADIYAPEGNETFEEPFAADLKTIDSVGNIEKNVLNFGYYRAGPYYTNVINTVVPDKPVKRFPLIFVEKTEPFRVRVVDLDDESWACGLREVLQDMNALSKCLKGQVPWEDAEENKRVIGLPHWYLKRSDDRYEGILSNLPE